MADVLLVEDEPELGRLVMRELEAAGYRVRYAADGPAALRLFAAAPPDLVVLDWMLPGLDGAPLDLTRTEFGLLHLLLRNRGRAFSRAYLHDAVWGEPSVEGDRSVDNAILRLRKKLGPLGEAIETVWGVGYRLAVRPSGQPAADGDG